MQIITYLAVIFIFFSGILNIFFPQIAWKLQHFLHVKGGEPTMLYLIGARVAGVLMVVISVLLFTGVLRVA